MEKYILTLIMIVLIVTSCSAPQHGFDYQRHIKVQKKMVKKMKRVNRRSGKTYFMIQNLSEGYFKGITPSPYNLPIPYDIIKYNEYNVSDSNGT